MALLTGLAGLASALVNAAKTAANKQKADTPSNKSSTSTTTTKSTPNYSTNNNYLVGLRDAAEGSGINVGWDANTGNVSLNQQQYTPQQLSSMGGKLENDKWSLPSSAVNALISNAGAQQIYPQQNLQQNTQQQQLYNELMAQLANQPNPDEIYNQIMSQMPKLEIPETLSYEQALRQAQDRLNPLYDEKMDQVLDAVDKNTLARGFFGQLPAAELKRSTAEQTERGKQNAISELAQSLIGQSQANADRMGQLGLQQQSANLNALIAALNQSGAARQGNLNNILSLLGYMDQRDDTAWERGFKEQQYGDSRGDVEWEKGFKEREYQDSKTLQDWQKGITEAQLTGFFKGEPTMAYTQLAHAMNMDERQAALAEKQANASIAQGWARINQAVKEFNHKASQDEKVQMPDEDEFMRAIKLQAYDMTLDYFKTNKGASDFGFTQDEFEDIYSYNVNRIMEGYDSTEDKINDLFKYEGLRFKNL